MPISDDDPFCLEPEAPPIHSGVEDFGYDYFRDFVVDELTGGLVALELDPTSIDKAVNRSLTVFNRIKPYRGYAIINAVPSGAILDKDYLTTNIHANLIGIAKCQFITGDSGSLALANELNNEVVDNVTIIDFNLGRAVKGDAANVSDRMISTLTLDSMQRQDARRAAGTTPDWNYDSANGSLSIFGAAGVNNIGLDYLAKRVAPTEIEYEFRDWFESYVLAECKYKIGRALGKFRSIDGPEGGVDLDGDTLREEGREERERLIEEANSWSSLEPLIG